MDDLFDIVEDETLSLDDDKEVTRLVGEKSVEEIENKLRCFEWKK